ncbi:hypothetical protein BU15DRAFT_68625 [Melanogaster broomeanus]|nr:hypothetical protein BU15DRAFT_68625 [Melanogaster broomeanus]
MRCHDVTRQGRVLNCLPGSSSPVTFSLAKFSAAIITVERLDVGRFAASVAFLLSYGQRLVVASVVRNLSRSTISRDSESILTDRLCIVRHISLQDDLHGNIGDTTKKSYNLHMAAPRRYFDPSRTRQFGPLRWLRSRYMSDLELLVFVSRGTCRFWTALEFGLNSVERIVEYLDLLREPQSSSSPAVHHKEDIVSVDRIILELITYGI